MQSFAYNNDRSVYVI